MEVVALMGVKSWLAHAFAVEPPGETEPDAKQKDVVDKICREVVRRHLTTPALIFLEMSRPLSYLSSQFLHIISPALSILRTKKDHDDLARFLEHRGAVDYFCRRIEEIEAEAVAREKTPEEAGAKETPPADD